ncbi:MAG: M24 family metallopeptidase [Candidatus Bathyarchaeia archaeon]
MSSRTEIDYQRFVDRYSAHYPRFSEKEFERRYSEIRKMMVSKGLGCLIIYGDSIKSNRFQANVRYVSNFVDEVMSHVFFPLEGEPTHWMDIRPHIPNARAVSIIKDIRCRSQGPRGRVDMGSLLAERIKEARLENGKIGIVGHTLIPMMPFDVMQSLKEKLPNAQFVIVTAEYDAIQTLHSLEEVKFMEKAAQLTDLAAVAMQKAIKPGVTEAEVYGRTHAAYLIRGGEFDFSLIGSTSMSDPNMPYPFPIPSNRRIKVGDIVETEISAGYWGYEGQVCRTFAVKKKPTKEWQDLFDLALEVYNDIQKVLKPGNTLKDVAKISTKITEAGYIAEAPVIHGLSPGAGYGSGYSVWVPDEGIPEVPNKEFKENLPIMIEPNPCTKDLKMGVFMGNANRVTEYGGKSYQKFPLEFIVTR